MKNLVKLAAMAAVVFQAGAMEVQRKENANQNANNQISMEYLKELYKNASATANTSLGKVPEPSEQEFKTMLNDVNCILNWDPNNE